MKKSFNKKMKRSEFIEKILKPLYIKISENELITSQNSEEYFKVFTTNISFYKQVDYIANKAFMYNLKGKEVKKLREMMITDLVIGLEDYFEAE